MADRAPGQWLRHRENQEGRLRSAFGSREWPRPCAGVRREQGCPAVVPPRRVQDLHHSPLELLLAARAGPLARIVFRARRLLPALACLLSVFGKVSALSPRTNPRNGSPPVARPPKASRSTQVTGGQRQPTPKARAMTRRGNASAQRRRREQRPQATGSGSPDGAISIPYAPASALGRRPAQ
jgi:hypothetical protein